MQPVRSRKPRSNPERSQATREALIGAARALFVRKGFARTSTPEIVADAGLTRGALYHHFRDKSDLLQAVLEQEARTVAAEIEAAAAETMPPRKALVAGAAAYLEAMRVPGRTRLLLIEGPAVLGLDAIRALDEAHAERTLSEGLAAAASGVASGASARGAGTAPLAVAPLAMLLSAAFDRAALAIEAGADAAVLQSTVVAIIERVTGAGEAR